MICLNYRDSRPIYEQIKDGLKKLIVSGAMAPGEKLPSVRALAQQLSINPNTIQRAYNELENEGYIYSIAGKGSFVRRHHFHRQNRLALGKRGRVFLLHDIVAFFQQTGGYRQNKSRTGGQGFADLVIKVLTGG